MTNPKRKLTKTQEAVVEALRHGGELHLRFGRRHALMGPNGTMSRIRRSTFDALNAAGVLHLTLQIPRNRVQIFTLSPADE